MAAVGWDTRLGNVVGDKTAKKLKDALGLTTVGELLLHYPRTFVDRGEVGSVDDLAPGQPASFAARVVGVEIHTYLDRRTRRPAFRVEAQVALDRGAIWMTFFAKNKGTADWHVGRLPVGRTLLFSGVVDRSRFKGGRWELTHPDFDDEHVEGEQSSLRPIYPVSARLSSWVVERAVRIVLDVVDEVPERIPQEVRRERGLLTARQALAWIHQPDDWKQWGAAAKRLRFDEAFVTQVVLAQRRLAIAAQRSVARPGRAGGLLEQFDHRLPFRLTGGQEEVSAQILGDLAVEHPMHRLLQGEVGSGKTVVALRAMLQVVDSGGQAVLLAPTEVLAQQHHRSITALLGDLAAGGMLGGAEDGTQVALITGSVTGRQRRAALLDAASGAAGIVVGTHALLEERVQFADLGLVVVDEQHRFGVEQRAALSAKGDRPPHVLVMTATPIPRTVAMTVFGDLETSTLAELPAGRASIQTNVVPTLDRPEWLDRAWVRAREEVESGRQVYVVCPRIGDDLGPAADEAQDEAQAEPGSEERRLAAVAEVGPRLAAGPLQGHRVEVMHGRLPADRKDELMQAFAKGDVDVLVSTTVIEVGVDVPNASMMVILDADRFGVSQLHQLRGRVGRGEHAGLCLLVSEAEPETPARQRLDAVAATLDGFELSRVDLQQRHEGDVLGRSQSGRRRSLRLLSVIEHEDVIVAAREAAVPVVEADPGLAGHPDLAAAVLTLNESEQADFLEMA